uniref:WD repeat-containing protein 54 beta-propeller domain-containing protein n=1 Tax=Ficedula albicollis TaxID=59894 RepID=U3K2K9_FICAL
VTELSLLRDPQGIHPPEPIPELLCQRGDTELLCHLPLPPVPSHTPLDFAPRVLRVPRAALGHSQGWEELGILTEGGREGCPDSSSKSTLGVAAWAKTDEFRRSRPWALPPRSGRVPQHCRSCLSLSWCPWGTAGAIPELGTVLLSHLSPQDGAGDLVTADDSGTLCLWSTGEEFTLLGQIPGSGCTCSSVRLWNGIVAAGYGDGQIRLWEAGSGRICAQVSAHARWIYALDLAPLTGKLLSGAEDSFVHVWKLSRNPDTDDIEIQHCHAECVTDTQVCGARFCDPVGDTFAVTGYDLSEILCYGPA